MKKILRGLHKAAMTYFAWGWPILLVTAALDHWAGESAALWRQALNDAAFAWILCAPVAPLTLLVDRDRRERAMAKLCGLRDGDERERAVTGEAARATLLLGLSLQSVLLVMTMVSVHLLWNPLAKKTNEHGLLTVGLSFDSTRHLDPFGTAPEDRAIPTLGPDLVPGPSTVEFGGFLLSPALFPILALLILIQVAAFKAFSGRRYEGAES